MRKKIAIPIAVLMAAGLAGGAFAASQSNSNPEQAFINDAAGRLHVTPRQLTGALRQALIDRVKAAAARGQLSKAQARAIERRIGLSSGVPFGPGPFLFGPGGVACGPGSVSIHGFGPPPLAVPVLGPPAILASAAGYLHLSQRQLRKELNTGKTLVEIAKAQGKTRAGLERALTSSVRSRLQRAVKSGRFPRRLESKLLAASTAQIHRLVDAHWRFNGSHGGFEVTVNGAGGPPGPPFLGPRLGMAMKAPCQVRARVQRVP